nr:uracil-DNA glycosylase [Halobacillus campisalis]
MDRVNCFKCKHFFSTWNPQFPRGCKAYGFKGREMPSQTVLKTTGTPCLQFRPKTTQTEKKKQRSSSRLDIQL